MKIAILIAALAGGVVAQEPEPPPVVEWPDLPAHEEAAVKRAIQTLEKSTDDEEVAGARDELERVGAAAAPALLRTLGNRIVEHPDRLESILDELVVEHYAPLVRELTAHRQPRVRRYAFRRLAVFHDPGSLETLRKAGKKKADDPDVAFFIAVGLCGRGDLGPLDDVFARCREEWPAVGAMVTAALTSQRGPDAASRITARIRKDPDDEREVVTGLRLLRSLAPKDYAGVVKSHLESRHNTVKKAAINTLRVIVDGDPPLEDLSVFEVIRQAESWKARL